MPSKLVTKSELDLFTTAPTQYAIEASNYEKIYPVAPLDPTSTSPIEFILHSSSDYLNLADSFIEITAKIQKVVANTLVDLTAADANNVGPTNLLLHNMFARVDMSLNDTMVSTAHNTYAYRAYIETILNYDTEYLESQGTMALYYKDDSDNIAISDPSADPTNSGLTKRASLVNLSKDIHMLGTLHLDLFTQPKYLLNAVEVSIKLIRQNNSKFSLMAKDAATEYAIVIKKAVFNACFAKLGPDIQLSIEETLRSGPARYPIRRAITKNYAINTGHQEFSKDNCFLNELPDILVIGIVDSAAFSGDYTKNPYNFEHCNLTYLNILTDGRSVPYREIRPDFSTTDFQLLYSALFSGRGCLFHNFGSSITPEDFTHGFTLFHIDLTPDRSNYSYVHHGVKTGNLRVEMKFKNTLTATKQVILYGQFLNEILIDKDRKVYFDYKS